MLVAYQAFSPATLAAEDDKTAPTPIDFVRDVEPIFRAKCYSCHGAMTRSGGLRLTEKRYAAEGGDSTHAVLGGTAETNELLLRVTSEDSTFRMPKRSPRLSDDQIAIFRRWVEAGTPWPEDESIASLPVASPNVKYEVPWMLKLERTLVTGAAIAKRFQVAIFIALVALGFTLAVERGKRATRPSEFGTSRSQQEIFAWLSLIGPAQYVALWAIVVSAICILVARDLNQELTDRLTTIHKELYTARTQLKSYTEPAVGDPLRETYGDPPMPFRPGHAKRLRGTYYRGNCERSPELFNYGNYLTAMFHVSLCDAAEKPIDFGDQVAGRELFVRFEIERAPNTTSRLFTEEIMNSVFLTPQIYSDESSPLLDQPIKLHHIAAEQRWAASVPIGAIPPEVNDEKLSGLIYVYTGRVLDETIRGTMELGIRYDLAIAGGKLQNGSEVWLGSLTINPAVARPQQGRIPTSEWFDHRPIPPITGENSQDPRLLGVEEHEKKAKAEQPKE